MVVDLNKFPMHKRPYSDKYLKGWSKARLIQYIRDLEFNYENLYDAYQNSVRYGESLYDRMKEVVPFDEQEKEHESD